MDLRKSGAFIAQQRKAKNLTQKELAEKLHITDKAVSKWEQGRSFPDVSLLSELADILSVTVTELINGEKTPPGEDAMQAADSAVLSAVAKIEETVNKAIMLFICGLALILSLIWEYGALYSTANPALDGVLLAATVALQTAVSLMIIKYVLKRPFDKTKAMLSVIPIIFAVIAFASLVYGYFTAMTEETPDTVQVFIFFGIVGVLCAAAGYLCELFFKSVTKPKLISLPFAAWLIYSGIGLSCIVFRSYNVDILRIFTEGIIIALLIAAGELAVFAIVKVVKKYRCLKVR